MTADELRALVAQGPAVVMSAKEDLLALLDAYERASALIRRADEELRLIRMKDCDALYDITLRMELGDYIAKHGPNQLPRKKERFG